MAWMSDPSNGNKPSVTLTLTFVAFIAALIGAGLEIAGVTKGTSILTELFVGNLAAYLGRRMSWGGKSFSSESTGENK
jgi:hypothetical protein